VEFLNSITTWIGARLLNRQVPFPKGSNDSRLTEPGSYLDENVLSTERVGKFPSDDRNYFLEILSLSAISVGKKWLQNVVVICFKLISVELGVIRWQIDDIGRQDVHLLATPLSLQ